MLNPAELVVVTMGDPAGIGPELLMQAWCERYKRNLPAFYCLADPLHMQALAAQLELPVDFQIIEDGDLSQAQVDRFNVVPLGGSVAATCGKPDPAYGHLVVKSIDMAVEHLHEGRCGAMVTNPISKKVLYDCGFKQPGHTEYLGDLSASVFGVEAEPVMLLAGPELMTIPLTVHIPLADVPSALTQQRIVRVARVAHRDLQSRFGIARPRLAFAGLNPHAGESGAMGEEEITVMAPALAQLQSEGINALGPYPADTMFHGRARAGYDVALAAYHDQALIPVKTIGFDESVNVTLGLPFIRVSPDHGTAFDLAGSGKGNPDSLSAALRLAATMAKTESV
ncbi:4-hydroxythreonine-4-phosphate dehydrogenase PdxA [Polycladidibacter hongkongensis]|uniref:4-hydroxythreonine-4-phosphate dehydrogenase PdxA n=1 Tax=Polycladidibacter hongkongensis TaxID=1647556 RepID=UPI00082B36A5|nr:4-hydroxythreonine-4-phosphate dehydrogenase PdxA [Pseudovibrio hongkongensis]